MSSIFVNGGYEYFTFERFSLSGGLYIHSGYITDYINSDSTSISIDFTRDVIGSISLRMRNHSTLDYLSDLVKIWYNIVVNGTTYSYPLGVYTLSIPSKEYDGLTHERNVQGFDLLLALQQDTIVTSYSVAASTNVVTAIETVLGSVGTWVSHSIEPCTETLPYAVSFELGTSKLKITNSLLEMINYYPLWCDGNGTYKSIPWSENTNTTYEFIDNDESLYESELKIDNNYAEIYNRVVVINNQLAEDTPPLYKIWTLEDEGLSTHPFSYTSIGRYATKKLDSEAVTQDYVDLCAKKEIRKMLEIEESVSYKHAFVCNRDDGLPWQGDSYRFKNTSLGVDAVYKIESQRISLKTGVTVDSTINRIRNWS